MNLRFLNLFSREEMGKVSLDMAPEHKKTADLTEEDLQELLSGVDVNLIRRKPSRNQPNKLYK